MTAHITAVDDEPAVVTSFLLKQQSILIFRSATKSKMDSRLRGDDVLTVYSREDVTDRRSSRSVLGSAR